jgi:hypothetical protein
MSVSKPPLDAERGVVWAHAVFDQRTVNEGVPSDGRKFAFRGFNRPNSILRHRSVPHRERQDSARRDDRPGGVIQKRTDLSRHASRKWHSQPAGRTLDGHIEDIVELVPTSK